MGYALKKPQASYADIEALPPHVTGELIAGQLYTQPRPFFQHSYVSSELGVELGSSFGRKKQGPGGWVFSDEPEVHFSSGDVLVPDIAGWRRERWVAPAAKQHIHLAPDWVCEVLSESTEVVDRGVKMDVYGSHQVGHVWLIDPVEQRVEVYRNEQGRYHRVQHAQGAQRVRFEPFEAMEFDLALLWEY